MKNFYQMLMAIVLTMLLHTASNAQSWLTAGNTVGSGDHKLGTIDNKPVNFISKNKTRMTIKPDGRIGMGTTDPTAFLHVFGTMQIENNASTIYDEPLLTLRNSILNGTPTNPVIAFKGEDTLFAVMGYDFSTRDVVISAQPGLLAPNLIINHDNGFVGLNTKTPAAQLHILGNQILDGDLTMASTLGKGDINFSTDQQNIAFTNPGATPSAMIYMFSSPTANKRMVLSHSIAFSNWGLQYDDADDQFDFLGSGSSKLSIDLSDGTVGVGIQNPTEKFEVNGGARFFGNIGVQTAPTTNTIQCGSTQGALIGIGTAESIQDAGANQLSVNADWLPRTDVAYHLGNSSSRWIDVWAQDGTINTSDARMKTNIHDLNYGLNEIMKLRPVSYQWKNDQSYTKLGVIAQEIQTVLPEVVRDWIYVTDEKTGVKTKVPSEKMGVMYDDIIPVLIKGMQEQQEQIESKDVTIADQQSQIDALKNSISEIKASLQACGITCLSSSEKSSPVTGEDRLNQNVPNPADGSTVIGYSLRSDVTNAIIEIRNINGAVMKSFSISGNGSITISAFDLPAGSYQYSLMVDGKEISTKQMVIAR